MPAFGAVAPVPFRAESCYTGVTLAGFLIFPRVKR